jgi:dipeptidyl aminopeptidase/acylaminoacyl peptidase
MDLSDIKKIHYNLERRSFDSESGVFGKAELVFNATDLNKSVSFPRLSPDGKCLIMTLSDYGTFPIWHQEADLYLLNLQDSSCTNMSLNSKMTESYHSWSSNGRWLVFSSKRIDGRSAAPFFAYISEEKHIGKPFVLPQSDPLFYRKFLESFNIPEFVTGKMSVTPRDFARAIKQKSVQSKGANRLTGKMIVSPKLGNEMYE